MLRGHVTYTVELNVCQENSLEQEVTALTAVMQKLSTNTEITCDSSDFHEYVPVPYITIKTPERLMGRMTALPTLVGDG